MRRLVLLVMGSGLIGCGFASVLGGCEDEPAPSVSTLDSGTGTSSGGGTSGGGTSSGGPNGTNDAGDDGSTGGVASNPGKITCGGTECDVASPESVCCEREAGASQLCTRRGDCINPTFTRRCDEKADCPEGSKCCFLSDGLGCSPSCPALAAGEMLQVCKTNEECGDAGPCTLRACGANRRQLRVCGTPRDCP